MSEGASVALGALILLIVFVGGFAALIKICQPIEKRRRERAVEAEILRGMNAQAEVDAAVERLRKQGLI